MLVIDVITSAHIDMACELEFEQEFFLWGINENFGVAFTLGAECIDERI